MMPNPRLLAGGDATLELRKIRQELRIANLLAIASHAWPMNEGTELRGRALKEALNLLNLR